MGYIGGSIVMGIPQALWMAYIVENPTKMDDRGTPVSGNCQITNLMIENCHSGEDFEY